MSSVSRETSRDRHGKPQQIQTEAPRLSSIPMWDSSDPERAPPPLPLNPGRDAGNVSPVRANTSEGVAAAARALVERARESMSNSHPNNASLQRSPDKSLIRTPQHKRLQSLQHASLRAMGETPTEKSARSTTPSSMKDYFPPRSPDSPSRSVTPTPSARDVRSRPIIEGTPPSATVLAIEAMQLKGGESPLGDVTNNSTVPKLSNNVDHLYKQIQNITSIANHLQQEMAALSRRSRDNATDLISLKEATNMRDEDIRKALRELVNNVRNRDTLLSPLHMDTSRSSSAMSQHHQYGSPTFTRSVQLSHDDAEHERGRTSEPRSIESSASMTMLESIIRDMATKEGHDKLSSTLTNLLEKSSNMSRETTRKLEDLVDKLREKEENLALVRHKAPRRRSSINESIVSDEFQSSAHNIVLHSGDTVKGMPHPSSFVNEEMKQMLRRIKDGISQSGGMTSEVKTLVRELRGEVLGMGRELGRKLDQSQSVYHDNANSNGTDGLERIIRDGLKELKVQMEGVIQTRRRESSGSAMSRNTIDSVEVAEAVKHALAQYDIQLDGTRSHTSQDGSLNREAILAAVREAYESYKPEIELQHFGLERDEILQCLKQGLEDYQRDRSAESGTSITREEILETIHGAVQQFQPPTSANDAAEIKEEVMAAVRECLESFNPQPAADAVRGWKPGDITHGDLRDAVREGLGDHKKSGAREIEIDRDDLHEAVRAGLETTHVPYGQQVIESLREIIEGMKKEFQQYSAANGRDTEQVLDAVKDGLENLRAEIESYVDRAQDVTGKDEIIESLKTGFAAIQNNLKSVMGSRNHPSDSANSNLDLLAYVKTEFQSLHEVINSQMDQPESSTRHKEDIIRAIMAGFGQMEGSGAKRSLDEPSDELLDAFKAEFEQLQANVLHGTASHKDEILESIQDSLSTLHGRLSGSDLGPGNYDLLNTIRDEFSSLRESLQMPVLASSTTRSPSSNETVETVKNTMEEIRVQLSADQQDASRESLGHIREELENLRAAIGGSLMLSSTSSDKEELIDAVRAALEDTKGSPNHGGLEAIREELEQMRQSLTNSLVMSNPSPGPDVVHNLHGSLDSLRNDISKMADKPVDMTVSYEILETLKSGLDAVRNDLDQLKTSSADQVVLASQNVTEPKTSATYLEKNDIERLEVMLAQLQIKVEAMDQNMQNVPQQEPQHERALDPGATKDDIASMELILRDLHAAVDDLGTRIAPETATKEDANAIETLLRNTKAQIDDHVLPALNGVLKMDQIETLEALVKLTQENVDTLMSRVGGNSASKDDIASIAHMVDETTTSLNDLKTHISLTRDGDEITKADLDLIGVVCMEIKNKISDMAEDNDLPRKTDVEMLCRLLVEFRESHEKLRDRYEGDIEITAKAFDDRKEESAQILHRIENLRIGIDEANEEMKQRLKKGNSDVRAIDEILLGIEGKLDASFSHGEPLQELVRQISVGIEKAHTSLHTIRAEQGDQASSILEKSEAHHTAIISALSVKLDDHLKTILDRQDAQQITTEEASKAITDGVARHEDLLDTNKTVTDDLRISIDTLGATVSCIEPAIREATDRMGDDAKTVFSKIDEVQARLEEAYLDSKSEHQLTRSDFEKSISAISEVRTEIMGQHPEAMGALKALLVIAEQHFELARNFKETVEGSSNNIKAHVAEEIRRLPAPLLEGIPHAERYDDSALHSKLDKILDTRSAPEASEIHNKLDALLSRNSVDLDSKFDGLLSQMKGSTYVEKLDAIQNQLTMTESEIRALLASQSSMLEAQKSSQERQARDAEMSLSNSRAEKEALQADIDRLQQSKQLLTSDVEQLKAHREHASNQKMKLSAELSSLETALVIRREELHAMDVRADALERRIIDGVMDHSRAMLLTKQTPKAINMSLKRVASNNSAASVATTTPTMVNSYIHMALGKPNPNVYRSRTTASPNSRRIASLNQISSNVTPGGKGLTPLPKAANGGISNLKRSQSVRNQAVRKTSWVPGGGSLGGFDKENDIVSEDSEAEQEAEAEYEAHRSVSQANSRVINETRKSSMTGSSEYTYATGSEYTYGTGSYVTGSDIDRRSSIGSTIHSSIRPSSSLELSMHQNFETRPESGDTSEEESSNGTRRESGSSIIHSSPLAAGQHEGSLEPQPEDGNGRAMILANDKFELPNIRTDGYDSGLGSDLPTATGLSAIEGSNRDYFHSTTVEGKQ